MQASPARFESGVELGRSFQVLVSEHWRAGRNKTANTYVIEISLQFRTQGDRLKPSQKSSK